MPRRPLVVAICTLYSSFALAASNSTLPHAPAEAVSLADADIALADGPIAQFINPAGISAGNHEAWSVGFLTGRVQQDYTRPAVAGFGAAAPGDYRTTSYPVIPFAAVARHYSDRLTAGLSLDVVNGVATQWDHGTWAVNAGGQTFDLAHSSDLKVVRLGPAAAWALTPNWNVGARVFLQYVDAMQQNDLLKVSGDGYRGGYQLGVRFHNDDFIFGVAYTSHTNTQVKGEISNVSPMTGIPAGSATADIMLPDRLQAGAAFALANNLWWELDLDWMRWSYVDNLTIVASNGAIANAGKNTRHYRNTLSVATGVRWRYTPTVTWQAGLGYDPTPTAEQDVEPTSSMLAKIHAAAGVLYSLSPRLRLDVAYQYLYSPSRTVTQTAQDNLGATDTHVFEGTYKSSSHVIAVTLNGTL